MHLTRRSRIRCGSSDSVAVPGVDAREQLSDHSFRMI